MKGIPDGAVDLVLTDPPYGTMDTDGGRKLGINGWDLALKPSDIFGACSRVLRQNGKAILFSQEPYTSQLITMQAASLPFSYRAVWIKNTPGNILGCNKAMVSRYEDVCVFSKCGHDYARANPIREYALKIKEHIGYSRTRVNAELGGGYVQHFLEGDAENSQFALCTRKAYQMLIDRYGIDKCEWFIAFGRLEVVSNEYKRKYASTFNLWQGRKSKSNVLEYTKDGGGFHPTQKPVALLEDLIQTFSNPGDTVLDFTMGSGSTGVACVNTGRNFIGIELDETYFQIAEKRINAASEQTRML